MPPLGRMLPLPQLPNLLQSSLPPLKCNPSWHPNSGSLRLFYLLFFFFSREPQDVINSLNLKIDAMSKDNETLKAQLQVTTNKFRDSDIASETKIKELENKKGALEKDLKKTGERVSALEKQLESSSKAGNTASSSVPSQSQALLAEKDRRIAQLEQQLAAAKTEADKVTVLEREVAFLKFRLEEETKKADQAEAAKASAAAATSTEKIKPWTPPKPTAGSPTRSTSSDDTAGISSGSLTRPAKQRPKSAVFAQFENSGVIIGVGAPKKPAIKRDEESMDDGSSVAPESSESGSLAREDSQEQGEEAGKGGIISRTQVKGPKRRPPTGSQSLKGQEAILFWCQQKTEGYAGVHIENFTTSWESGLALWLALAFPHCAITTTHFFSSPAAP